MSKRKSSQSHLSRNIMSFYGSRSSGGSSDLVAFYEGTGHDSRGRSLGDILRWNASKLESSHDYIQTVFPLPEASGVNWDAPIIDRRVFDAFRSRPELRTKLRESFQKILWFYGFKLEKEGGVYKVVKGDNYDKHNENWDSRFDHNHLRITRIIRCLRVLGLEKEALAFRAALDENHKYVSPRSREYWRRAAERDLNVRPDFETDDSDDDMIGPNFLREYEKERKKGEAKAGDEKVDEEMNVEEAGGDADAGADPEEQLKTDGKGDKVTEEEPDTDAKDGGAASDEKEVHSDGVNVSEAKEVEVAGLKEESVKEENIAKPSKVAEVRVEPRADVEESPGEGESKST